MTPEFNLSEKIFEFDKILNEDHTPATLIRAKDVKEFIRLLKEEFQYSYGLATQWVFDENMRILNKLAGEKLR